MKGYVVLVGLEATSQSNNPMFDIMVQRAKSDVVMVRIMTNNVIARDQFLAAVGSDGEVLVLNNISDTADGMYFYNPANGATHTFVRKDLSFAHESFSKFVKKLSEHDATGIISIECRIKYLGGVKPVNGSELRNGVLYDNENEMLVTIWNPTFWNLSEEKTLYFAHLGIEDFFGIKLKTMKNTIVMENDNADIQDIPTERLKPLRIRGMGFQNVSEVQARAITMAEVRCTVPCPSKMCKPRGEIQQPPVGNVGKCSNCKGKANLLEATKEMSGELVVKDLSLTIEEAAVDITFGDGVAKMYMDKTEELELKFLGLTDVVVEYDKKSMKLVCVTAAQL